MASALMGSLRISCFVDRGTFWVLPLVCFHLPKSARAYLFPQSVKHIFFCCGPVSQPNHAALRDASSSTRHQKRADHASCCRHHDGFCSAPFYYNFITFRYHMISYRISSSTIIFVIIWYRMISSSTIIFVITFRYHISLSMLISSHFVITWYRTAPRDDVTPDGVIPVSECFGRALLSQAFSGNCYPAPDSVLQKPIFLIVLSSGGMSFLQAPVSRHIKS